MPPCVAELTASGNDANTCARTIRASNHPVERIEAARIILSLCSSDSVLIRLQDTMLTEKLSDGGVATNHLLPVEAVMLTTVNSDELIWHASVVQRACKRTAWL